MIREFQAIYRETRDNNGVTPVGEVRVVLLMAEAVDQVESRLRRGGLLPLGIQEIRPVIDWRKPNFDRDEFAAFLCVKGSTISKNKGANGFPFAAIGTGIYPRRLCEQYIEEHLNPAGRKLAALAEIEA